MSRPCPRHPSAVCIHRHCMVNYCLEIAYEEEKPHVDAELRRREQEKKLPLPIKAYTSGVCRHPWGGQFD